MDVLRKARLSLTLTLVALLLSACGDGDSSSDSADSNPTESEGTTQPQLASRPVIIDSFDNNFVRLRQLVLNDNVTSIMKAPSTIKMFADVELKESGGFLLEPRVSYSYIKATDGTVVEIGNSSSSNGGIGNLKKGQNVIQLNFPVQRGKHYTKVHIQYSDGPKGLGWTELRIDIRTE